MFANCLRRLAVMFVLSSSSLAVFADSVNTLSLSLFTPPSNLANQVLQQWAGEISDRTDGRLAIELFPSGQMGPTTRQFDLVRIGTVDMAWVMHGFTPGRFPTTEAAYLPGLFQNALMGSKALINAAPRYLQDEHRAVKILAFTYGAPLKLFTHSFAVHSLADIQGKRLRYPSKPNAATLRALGAEPVNVPPLRMGEAISAAQIDGVVTNYEAAASMDVLKRLKYVTNLDLGSVTFALVMNEKTYEGLPGELRSAIDELSGESLSVRLAQAFDAAELQAKAKAFALGIQEIEVSSAEQQKFDEAILLDRKQQLRRKRRTGGEQQAFYDYLRGLAVDE